MSARDSREIPIVVTNLKEDEVRDTIELEAIDQEYVAVDEEYAKILEEDKPSLDNFARGEVLSHELPYKLAKDLKQGESKVVSVIDEDGVKREYNAQSLYTTHEGLKAFVLSGTDAENPRVKVLFRGTKCKASVIRDLESYGAGQQSFNKNEKLLLAQVFDVINERAEATGKKVKLDVAGHSLGGADAQNFTAAIAESCAKRAEDKRLAERKTFGSKIKSAARKLFGSCLKRINKAPLDNADALDHLESVEMHTANSAGVGKKTAKKFKKAVEVINDPLHSREEKPSFSLNCLMVAGDGVQQTGQTSIGAEVDPKHANVKVLKVDTGQGKKWASSWNLIGAIQGLVGTVSAHTSKHFIGKDGIPAELSYTLLDNKRSEEEREIIKSKLTKKSWFENSSFAYWVKKAAINISKLFKSCKKDVPEKLVEMATIKSDKELQDAELSSKVLLERKDTMPRKEKVKYRTTDDLANSVLLASEPRTSLLRQYGNYCTKGVGAADDSLLTYGHRRSCAFESRVTPQDLTQSMVAMPRPRRVC